MDGNSQLGDNLPDINRARKTGTPKSPNVVSKRKSIAKRLNSDVFGPNNFQQLRQIAKQNEKKKARAEALKKLMTLKTAEGGTELLGDIAE